MPLFTVIIAPLVALYIKFKLVQYAVKLALFLAIYLSFKSTLQWGINEIMTKIGVLNMPCMISYVLNSLDVFSMINFALSFFATIKIGKFFYNSLVKLI